MPPSLPGPFFWRRRTYGLHTLEDIAPLHPTCEQNHCRLASGKGEKPQVERGFQEKFCWYSTGQSCNFWKGQCSGSTISLHREIGGKRQQRAVFLEMKQAKTSHHTKWDVDGRGKDGGKTSRDLHPQAPRGFSLLPEAGPLGPAQHEAAAPPSDLLQPAPKSLSYQTGGPTSLGQSLQLVPLDPLCLKSHMKGASSRFYFSSWEIFSLRNEEKGLSYHHPPPWLFHPTDLAATTHLTWMLQNLTSR